MNNAIIICRKGREEKIGSGRQRKRETKERMKDKGQFCSNLPKGDEFQPKMKPFFLPGNFDLDDILPLNFPLKFYPNIILFLGLVHNITTFKRIVIREENPYARINSAILSEFLLTLGNDTKKMLRRLESEKWIEVDHSYKVGSKSKGYRIGPALKDLKWIKKDWRESLELFVPQIKQKSIISRRKDVLYSLWDRACLYFTSWHTMQDGDFKDICRRSEDIGSKISVDYRPEIHEVIRECAIEHMEDLKRKGEESESWTLEMQIESYYNALSLFDGDNFGASCHDPYRYEFGTGRIYTNVVNLKKELRQFLHVRGEPFVNIDIQSCQPALLSSFYLPEDAAEKAKFISILCGQDIYTFLAPNIPRPLAKEGMYKIMFGQNRYQTGALCDRFRKEFPILSERLKEKKKTNHKLVAYEMQKMEASIMILSVLKSLYQEDIPCLSIHDSIFCHARYANIVKERMFSFFFAKMNFCPNIRID